ncbi:MAG: hypothetical protein Q9220_003931 [cf. Caloplaca sp. 1 TL-2023]
METESKRLPRKERRGSMALQPHESVSSAADDQHPMASPPLSPPKTSVNRSMSRYKGIRAKSSRNAYAPLIPAVPSSQSLGAKEQGQYNIQLPTTSDPFQPAKPFKLHNAIIHASPVRATVGKEPLEVRTEEAEPTTKARHQHYRHKPVGGTTVQVSGVGITQTEGFPVDSSSRHQKFQHQGRSSSLKFTQAGQSLKDRNIEKNEHEKRDVRLPIEPTVSPKKISTRRIIGQTGQPQSAAEARAQSKQMISLPVTVESKEAPTVALFDVPKSAANAGERSVKVRYKDFQVPVAISASTTPTEVIQSVADKIALPIHQESPVLLESFKQLGLERPLRFYENIRDVLNSWDDDAQNSLIIEPSSSGGDDDDLYMTSVSKRPPDDSSFYSYHSQRPGYWDKRVVTLRSDGQMSVAKPNSAEISNICHLSDFDIYIPTARQLAKKIKPPKRICFAVKSQQKSNMFMSTVNFVHFFSSNDRKKAKSLYLAVQGWRSWYLVNTMGKGQADTSQATKGHFGDSGTSFPTPTRSKDIPQRPKDAIRAQQIPADLSNRVLDAKQTPTDRDALEHVQQTPIVRSIQKASLATPADVPFTNSGLLGRAYTERQKAQRNREAMQTGPLAQVIPSSPSIFKGNSHSLGRTSSQRQKPKPLIDLTPLYQEPPQHLRKGRGVTLGQLPTGRLVDSATSPEAAIPISPTMEWREPGTSPQRDGL